MTSEERLPRPAYYSTYYGAWVLSTYADVTMALRHPHIRPVGSPSRSEEGSASAAHAVVRRATHHAMPSAQVSEWRDALTPLAQHLVESMAEQEADLVATVAVPWCTALAAMVVAVPHTRLDECMAHARTLFLASAHATNGEPQESSINAALALATHFSAPDAMSTSAHVHPGSVQAFVAVSQSLPGAMASIWCTLLQHTDQIMTYQRTPTQRNRIIEELLRIASPSRAVFRVAHESVRIDDVTIPANDHVILRLADANVDPTVFHEPLAIRLDRPTTPHVSLGLGPHHCAGASVVRMALECTTSAIFANSARRPIAVEKPERTRRINGYAIDGPLAVWAQLLPESVIDAL